MIYLDNAATTLVKPPEVAEAVAQAINSFGGVGRGVHAASVGAGVAVYKVRAQIARFFNAPSPSRVAFTYNITEALNIAIRGLLKPGDHVITTAASHNSVLRPLYLMRDEHDVELTVVDIEPDGTLDMEKLSDAFRDNTAMVAVTHASNLTGNLYDVAHIAELAHEHDALCLVDAAQTAGIIDIDMERDRIDVLCFTGHKSLYGPQGTGGLCVAEGIEIPPFKVGGTGVHSYDEHHPTAMPDSLEAGTINAHGIAGLAAGVAYLEEKGLDAISEHIFKLAERFDEGVRAIEGVRIYGRKPGRVQSSIVALTVRDYDSGEVADVLSVDYSICTRAGAHCAPLMHIALGTQDKGAVRFSFSSFNTEEDVDAALVALREIAVPE